MSCYETDAGKDLELLVRERRAMRAEKEAEEKARRERRRQRYAYSSVHPFWDDFLGNAARYFSIEAGKWLGTKLAGTLSPLLCREPMYVPVRVETVNVEMPEERIALKTPRQYEHPFPVQAHLMNLGGGRKVSAEKLRTAEECGFVLREDGTQTWVKAYTKGENDP